LLRAMSKVEWLRINSVKPFGLEPFGPELTAEGLTAERQSRFSSREIATPDEAGLAMTALGGCRKSNVKTNMRPLIILLICG